MLVGILIECDEPAYSLLSNAVGTKLENLPMAFRISVEAFLQPSSINLLKRSVARCAWVFETFGHV